MNVRVVGGGQMADALRDALAQVGLYERPETPVAFVCTADDLPRAIAMRELAPATVPLVVMTDDPAGALEAGADDAGGTPAEVARRVAARLKVAPRAARKALEMPAEEEGSEAALAAAGKRQRSLILVVEDDGDARAVLEELLRDRYDVEAVGDGESAVKRAKELLPDLVLLDLFLPGLDGFGALSGLRRDQRTADVPVIFVSARDDAETKPQGVSLGAADYLAKPFSAQELMARVDRTLKLTAQKEHLRMLAQTDGLTGLPNFRSFHARLEEEVARADRYGHPLACAMVDLDGLKEINDRLGHAAGNRAILGLADAVRAELRGTDFAARYGGDEFVVLLPQTSAQAAGLFAERLRRRLLEVSDEAGLPVRASMGVAALSADEAGRQDAAEDLLRRADEQLYEAKRSGKASLMAGEMPTDLREGMGATNCPHCGHCIPVGKRHRRDDGGAIRPCIEEDDRPALWGTCERVRHERARQFYESVGRKPGPGVGSAVGTLLRRSRISASADVPRTDTTIGAQSELDAELDQSTQFRCARCKQIFQKPRPEEDASVLWESPESGPVFCGDCYAEATTRKDPPQ